MKRRFQGASDSDSLELLLDTLCNVFGGIVLIACLLAILPRQKMKSPLVPSETASAAMLERRMITVREEMIRIEAEIGRIESSTDPKLGEVQLRRDSLRRVHERLGNDHKDRQKRESSEADARALVAQGNPEVLTERLRELNLRRSSTEGIESVATEKIRFLEQRSANLLEESANIAQGNTQLLRFPRERPSDDSPFPIILRYDAVYPLVIGADFGLNNSIRRTTTSANDGFRAEPIRGRGIAAPGKDEQLAATLKKAAGERLYVTLYLYPDSHLVLSGLKEALAKAKISYGLEFVKSERSLSFGAEGSMPPKL
jgi:hypothetical protein